MIAQYWKGIALVLVAVVFAVQLNYQHKEMELLLILCTTALVVTTALNLLEPVIGLIRQLEQMGDIREDYLRILMKAMGVGLTGEIAAMICTDAGSASLGKAVQLLTSCGILLMSLPMFSRLTELIGSLLGEI